MPYNTSSNRYMIIFLNKNFVEIIFLLLPRLGFCYTCALKNEKNNLNQIKVDSLEKLENFPLATLINMVIILLIIY